MAVPFLPISREDMEQLNWNYLDFLIITGDAYVDHPSFGTAIIGRYLEYLGFKVGIIPQPDWRDPQSLLKLGTPGLGVLITAGNLDSMLNHYTSRKKKRSRDLYSPGGQRGLRPDRATIVYTNLARQVFRSKPIIIGGIEASLRRFAHYDYWDNKVRRSILFDSKADLLVYGMAEYQIKHIAEGLKEGKTWSELTALPGICYISENKPEKYLEMPSFEECTASKEAFAQAFKISYLEQDPIRGRGLAQFHQDNRYLIQNPPAPPLTQEEMDRIYNLPYSRTYHPIYKNTPVPALEEIKFSITSHRGCFGACAFCALHFHQGRIIQNRSHQSILQEAHEMTLAPDFKGYIHDVGGPTANFRQPSCKKQLKYGTCRDRQCLVPKPCPQLEVDHTDYLHLLRSLRKIPKIKKVFVRSGLRYDYLLLDKKSPFLLELCEHHISGQLKVAPEHAAPKVTSIMGKSPITVFDQFHQAYHATNKRLKKKQYLIPYFMSGHPGTTLTDAIYLAEYLRDFGFQPDQVQEFIPTPGSLSTCMYYTGLDPFTYQKVHVPDPEERILQRALLQYKKPENYPLVLSALKKAGRQDLIGTGKECLIPPPRNVNNRTVNLTKSTSGINKKRY
ncbi:YgiQ family radical SAM protein [Thermanaerosceptrum fracticalcis]|uniref:YgiQ family radical SAM protein n=1 Tax=Thermanaerosceptrum fracticalcis TaxID=1712410 RepID=A0A7G6E0U9_THEFR|nr:YgiQ family radical SAM protein [Thermanaerosceptrum fracticalcis]QNB45703.1 YgiQ family radical SAM protein [Thermanaerosceptrum fracticalcis]